MFFSGLFGRTKEQSTSAQSDKIGCAQSVRAEADDPVVASRDNSVVATQPAASPAAPLLSPAAGPTAGHSTGVATSSAAAPSQLLANSLTLPTTLSIPLDGYCVSVELAPHGPPHGGNGSTTTAINGLQVQIAQQMLAFATQQATLLQQALPFMLNLPPARVTAKLRELLTEVHAKPALEKLMKATGINEPTAQRVCIEYINRNGGGLA